MGFTAPNLKLDTVDAVRAKAGWSWPARASFKEQQDQHHEANWDKPRTLYIPAQLWGLGTAFWRLEILDRGLCCPVADWRKAGR